MVNDTQVHPTTSYSPRFLMPGNLNSSADAQFIPSLQLVRSSRFARRVAGWLLVLLLLTIVALLFAPWQQSIRGAGTVVAYAASERQQVIEAPIKGRVVRWGEDIYENAPVRAGQLIAEIQDLDPLLMQRLEDQRLATQRQVDAAEQQLAANRRNLEATITMVRSYQAQVDAYTEVKTQVIAAAEASIANARQKIIAEEQSLAEQHAVLAQVEADYLRQKNLYEEQIVSQLKFQEAERKYKEAEAKVLKAEAYVQAARDELVSKERDRDAKAQKAQVDIDYATAMLRKTEGEVAKAESEVAKAQSELTKAEKELLECEIKLSRQNSQSVKAPCDGYLVQIVSNQGGQILKEGDVLCVIVPDTQDRAVQLWVRGNDVPLIQPGRHVRLQFEGWPAVQFAGWPSVAVGTFGGKVVSIDAADNGKGEFRILVQPDQSDRGPAAAPWPDARYLRQGVRVNGWVLLDQVPLWFEAWRRMNAFPPVVSRDQEESSKTAKPPKIGKSG